MSARKLSRFAGLVFVLAAACGGAGAASAAAEHETRGSIDITATTAYQLRALDITWG